ncbi:MAG: hypothetical protein KDK36_16100 [Leptospiraceae bacterium]|nr:hypothetical protein [Leptospiraceae bacterium]
MKSIILKVIYLILLSGIITCSPSKNNEAQDQLITYWINSGGLNGENSCSNFASSENSCISSPDSILLTCSDSEVYRIKNIIEPPDKRTEVIMNAFFSCWSKCNILFNGNEAICLKNTKFSSSKAYRDAQRSGSTSASQTWGVCMNSCNKGDSTETGLAGTGASYPKSAY